MKYQFARFQNTVCDVVERWNTYNVLCKVENDNIVFNLLIQNCYICYLRIIIYFASIYIIYYFEIFFQLNSIITCYVCVQLIKFIYMFICICIMLNKVLLKVKIDLYSIDDTSIDDICMATLISD